MDSTGNWADLSWPRQSLLVGRIIVRTRGQSTGGGQAANDSEQIIVAPEGYFQVDYEKIIVSNQDQILAFRAIVGEMRGRAGTMWVPVYDRQRSPAGLVLRDRLWMNALTWNGGIVWTGMLSDIRIAIDAAWNDPTVDVSWASGAPAPTAGQYFSTETDFYLVTRFLQLTDTTARLKLFPNLADAAPAGTRLNFDDPYINVRFVDDEQGDLAIEAMNMGVDPSLKFVEANAPGG